MRVTLLLLALAGTLVVSAPLPSATAQMPTPGPGSGQEREFAAMLRACTDMMQQMIRSGGMMGGGMMGGGMMGRMMGPMMPGGWWPLSMLLFWVIVAGLIVALVVLVRRPREGYAEPMLLLKSRLARGEVSPDEYEQTRRLLQG